MSSITGLLTYGLMALFLALVLQAVEEWAGSGRRLEGLQRLFALVTLAVLGIALDFLFDWDQLAPGLGRVPQVVDAAVIGTTLSILYLRSLPVAPATATLRGAAWALVIVWASAISCILAVVLWLDGGVFWS